MPRRTVLLSTLSAVALGFTTANLPAEQNSGNALLICSVDITPQTGWVLVEGHVAAQRDLHAEYTLSVLRAGAEIVQSGQVHLRSGDSSRMGRVQIMGPESTLSVKLSVTAEGQQITCPSA